MHSRRSEHSRYFAHAWLGGIEFAEREQCCGRRSLEQTACMMFL